MLHDQAPALALSPPASTATIVDVLGNPLSAPLTARQSLKTGRQTRQGSLSLFDGVNGPEWIAEPDLSGFKDYQKQTAHDLFTWLKAGPGEYTSAGTRKDAIRVVKGVAGAGKSYLTKFLLSEFRRCCPGLFAESDNGHSRAAATILGCAPTGQAAGVLAEQKAPFDGVSTIASLFGIRPKAVELSYDDAKLLRLLELFDPNDLEPNDLFRLQCLRELRDAEQAGEVKFQCTGDPSKPVANCRLLVVDECGIVNRETALVFNDVFADRRENLRPDFQVLFVGDPEQCSPPKEIKSLTFGFQAVTPLTEVSRFGGLLLDLSVALRTPGTNLPRTIEHFYALSAAMPESDLPTADGCAYRPIEACREQEGFARMAALIQGNETARWIAPTNAAVHRINAGIQRAMKGCQLLDYRRGDKLLTLSAVTRGPNNECRYMKKDGSLLVPNSELLVVQSVKPSHKHESGFQLLEVEASGAMGTVTLILLDPNQAMELPAKLSRIAERAKAFGRDPKSKPGTKKVAQIDLLVFELWKELGVESWEQLGHQQRNMYRTREWAKYHSLKSCCDDVGYAAASTVHKAQGAQYQNVFLSVSEFFSGRMGTDYGRGTDWDIAAMLYTAATRAQQQLTFVY